LVSPATGMAALGLRLRAIPAVVPSSFVALRSLSSSASSSLGSFEAVAGSSLAPLSFGLMRGSFSSPLSSGRSFASSASSEVAAAPAKSTVTVPPAQVQMPTAEKIFDLVDAGKLDELKALLTKKQDDNARRAKLLFGESALVELLGKNALEDMEPDPVEFAIGSTIKGELDEARMEELKKHWLKATNNDTAWVNAMADKAKMYAEGVHLPDWSVVESMSEGPEWRETVAGMKSEASAMQDMWNKFLQPLPKANWESFKDSPFSAAVGEIKSDMEKWEPDYAALKNLYEEMKENEAAIAAGRKAQVEQTQSEMDAEAQDFENLLAEAAEVATIYTNMDTETIDEALERNPEMKERFNKEIDNFQWY